MAYDTTIPGSALQAQANLAATTAYQNALAQINQRRTGLLRSYGYQGTIDPNSGTVTNLKVDPLNPYGAYQQLLHSSASASQQARDTAEGRGLHGGLANQLARQVQYEHGAASSQLGQALTDALSGFQEEQLGAAQARDAALYQAQLDAARQAMLDLATQGALYPADYSGLDYPDYGDTGYPDTQVNPSSGKSTATVAQAAKQAQSILKQTLANIDLGVHVAAPKPAPAPKPTTKKSAGKTYTQTNAGKTGKKPLY